MKISRWLIITLIILILLAIIILSKTPSKKISMPERKITQEVPQPPAIREFELPKKEEYAKEREAEEKLPEMDIKDIPLEKLPEKKVKSKAPAIEETESHEEPQKFNKYPTPEQLHDLKQKGLVIY